MEKFDSFNHANNTFSPEENSAHFEQNNNSPQQLRHKGFISWQTLIIIMLLIMQLMNVAQTRQYKQYSEVVTQEAYVLSVSINLLED